ncbi:MAG: cob(I)yrinic acid a,c-diamide adenosyltransferase [Bacteroidetes bacterium]|nr:cob(I)yrinic acid a,c-diamide adenosyltransferase [Bacteroidota bacterium]
MKIYTKTGDAGSTSLIGGRRVAKNHPRVEAYGNVDELIATLGAVRACLYENTLSDCLLPIQQELMNLAAHLANDASGKLLAPIEPESILALEQQIDRMQNELPPLTAFVLPGPPMAAAYCHIARTVCRRAERSVIALGPQAAAPEILCYLNRLSDFLFVYSRYISC